MFWLFSLFGFSMMGHEHRDVALLLIALALAIIAAVFDVRQRRIPNRLTYPGIVLGLVLRGVLLRGGRFGLNGLGSAVAGLLLAGGVMFLFYAVRAMGAGDVKLMAAVGSLVGPGHAVVVLLATAICGGVMAIGYAVYRGQMWATVRNVASVLRFHAWAGLQAHPELNLDNPTALRMPYGLAIAAGTLYALLLMWWR
jgi:prepilin peptidase CpaA